MRLTQIGFNLQEKCCNLPMIVSFVVTGPVDTGGQAVILTNSGMNRTPNVAVVGATGAVGIEMIKTLEKRGFPVGKLTLLASARSVGKKLKFRGQEIAVTELTRDSFKGVDIALFSA